MKLIKKTISGAIAILEGMFTIAKHAFRKPITLEYPENKDEFSTRLRGRLALRVNEDGSTPCIGCKSCLRVCPCVDLIQIETSKGEDKKIKVDNFTVDIGRCIGCGNCVDICPTQALVMTDKYEIADFSKEAFVLDMKGLELSVEESSRLLKELEKDC